jgi:ribonuclease R
VACYVRSGSALDQEALRRGNSVYFPDRVVPMLPERLSSDLCSLKPQEDRPALAVCLHINPEGRVLTHSFHRIVMRSRARLSYVQAQAALDGNSDTLTGPLLENALKPLHGAYLSLKRAREARDPLDLDLPERKILLHENGMVDRVMIPQRLETHRLIEEFMIRANVAAAQTLEKARVPLLYRVHDDPSLEKLRTLRQVLASIGLSLAKQPVLRPALFNRILAQVAHSPHQAFVNEIVLRSQAQAEYSPRQGGHFGLNLTHYAHFTSPIRRYADLVVHRGLIRALKLGEDGLQESEAAALAETGAVISAAERRAMAAERETLDRLIAHHLADQVGTSFAARISGVTSAGLFVRLEETGADGFVPLRETEGEYFFYDKARHLLRGERSHRIFRLGDTLDVRLLEAAPLAGALRFSIIDPARPIRTIPSAQSPRKEKMLKRAKQAKKREKK